MKRLLILFLIALFGLSCFFVNSSDAASITSFSVDNGASGCYASLTADEDIMYIDWYLKQTYPKSEADDDYEHVHTSMHSAGTRSVCVNVGYLEGHIKIAEYNVKAMVSFKNPDDRKEATDTAYAKEPEIDSETAFGIRGQAKLLSQSYDGNNITIVCYNSAHNRSSTSWNVRSMFRHTLFLNGVLANNPNLDPTPTKTLKKNGGTYHASASLSEPVGEIRFRQTYKSNAYIRLTVDGLPDDIWHINHDSEFTSEDNR